MRTEGTGGARAWEFDRIAPLYDVSRGPMPPEVLDRLARALTARGVRSLLEIGVGTGRVARPLVDGGILVTGVDGSRGMLARARGKRLDRLVRGTAYALPFRAQAFDASLLVHVLHVFERPELALREGIRVGRRGACALLPVRHLIERRPRAGPAPYDVLREELRRAGLPMPSFRRPSETEREILERLPPDSLEPLGDRDEVESFDRRLEWIEMGADRSTAGMPLDTLREVVRRVRERTGGHRATFRVEYRLATWTHGPPGAPSRATSGPPVPPNGGG